MNVGSYENEANGTRWRATERERGDENAGVNDDPRPCAIRQSGVSFSRAAPHRRRP